MEKSSVVTVRCPICEKEVNAWYDDRPEVKGDIYLGNCMHSWN